MALQRTRITIDNGTRRGMAVDVLPNIGDTLRFESTLRKNKGWGPLADNAIKLQNFRAWSAAERTGAISMSWDEFSAPDSPVISVLVIDESDEAGEEGGDHEGVEAFTPDGESLGKDTTEDLPTN